MFQPKSLNLAIAAALGGMAAVSSNALADSAFFPHVVVSDTVTTFVSVINTSSDLYDDGGHNIPWFQRNGQGFLHYKLVYKNASNLTSSCSEYDKYLPTSVNDLNTIDLGATDKNGLLFETAIMDGAKPYDFAMGANRKAAAGGALRGYLLVDNAESDRTGYVWNEPTVFGEAIVVEWGVGATWGYQAFTKQDDSRFVQPGGDFDNEFDYEFSASRSGYPIALMPFHDLNTDEGVESGLMVTAVINPRSNTEKMNGGWIDSDMSQGHNNQVTLYMTLDESPTNWQSDPTGQFGMFDRDENPVSGGASATVTCVGRVRIAGLVGDNADLANGGWGRLRNGTSVLFASTYSLVTGAGSDTGTMRFTNTQTRLVEDAAVIYKLEYGARLDGKDIMGTWNNAFQIPQRRSVYNDAY